MEEFIQCLIYMIDLHSLITVQCAHKKTNEIVPTILSNVNYTIYNASGDPLDVDPLILHQVSKHPESLNKDHEEILSDISNFFGVRVDK